MSDVQRLCTCHPDDDPPVPCAKKYALSECRLAASQAECAELRLLLRQIFADLDAHEVLPEWLPIIYKAMKGE